MFRRRNWQSAIRNRESSRVYSGFRSINSHIFLNTTFCCCCCFFGFFSARLACRFIVAVSGARLSSSQIAAAPASGFKLENTVFDTLHFTEQREKRRKKKRSVAQASTGFHVLRAHNSNNNDK